MRSRRPVAVTLVALTAGLAAPAVLRRIAARRRSAIAAPTRSAPAAPAPSPAVPAVDREAVVLTFSPRTAPVPAPQQPVRCGDTGGRTKAGAPCGARATADGRCRHHRVAA
jgi:hypothetical protein